MVPFNRKNNDPSVQTVLTDATSTLGTYYHPTLDPAILWTPYWG